MAVRGLPRVDAIATEVHPAFPEDGEVPAERQRLFPAGCLVLGGPDAVIGYVVSHPWRAFAPPKLNTRLGAIPSPAETYYIHDLALLSAARGQGHARAAVELLAAVARNRGLPSMSLVAVSGSAPFWARHGFAESGAGTLDGALASYGADAVFMVRTLGRR